jgi:hypothetical protein
MIPALGAGGREFDSRITPLLQFLFDILPTYLHWKQKISAQPDSNQ